MSEVHVLGNQRSLYWQVFTVSAPCNPSLNRTRNSVQGRGAADIRWQTAYLICNISASIRTLSRSFRGEIRSFYLSGGSKRWL